MRTRISTAAVVLLAVATAATACGSSKHSTTSGNTLPTASKPSITIGAANFTENEVLAYVYADALKAAGYSAKVRPSLGTREVIEPALESGSIDATIEYVGNYLAFLNPHVGILSVAATAAALAPLVAKKGLSLGTVSLAADSDAIAVTKSNATKYHLVSIADLKAIASQWTLGGPAECATRITCVPGLRQFYGVVFKQFRSLDEDGAITHTALANGSVQAARIFSSDAIVAQDHFVVLTDPQDFQGAGNIIPVIRSVKALPGVLAVLNQVSAALTTADLIQFNLAVSVNHADPTTVASQFVTTNHLG
jgi:osmoprotectant transport system substrate-binding protein